MAEFVDKWQAVSNLVYAGLVDAQKAVDAIQYMHPADVRPVVHGKWHLNEDGSGTCSECGRTQYNCWDLDNWDNFCHFCGADMRIPVKETTESDFVVYTEETPFGEKEFDYLRNRACRSKEDDHEQS